MLGVNAGNSLSAMSFILSVKRLQEEKKDWERRASEGNERLNDALLRLEQAQKELGKKDHKLKKMENKFEDFKGRLLRESETPFEKLLKAVSTITDVEIRSQLEDVIKDFAKSDMYRTVFSQGSGQLSRAMLDLGKDDGKDRASDGTVIQEERNLRSYLVQVYTKQSGRAKIRRRSSIGDRLMMMQQRSQRDTMKERLRSWSFDPTSHDMKEVLAFAKSIFQDCGIMEA